MKKYSIILLAFTVVSLLVMSGCKKDKEEEPQKDSIVPAHFRVDIPDAISKTTTTKSGKGDTLQGNDIYEHLTNFIAIGESASELVEEIMWAIAEYEINQAMAFSYTSEEDGRAKNCVVVENSPFDGITWAYQMTIADAASSSNTDQGKALQVFWNVSPVKGIAIIKPYNCNRDENINFPDAMYRIDYSEAGEYGYDAHMIVSIAGIPLGNPLVEPYSINALKMFAGKTGDIIDVYGNSNHPNAKFFTDTTGFDWAFVASGSENSDIGVAEVGLPPNTLDETNRDVLLKTHSIKNVFTQQIYEVWPSIDSNTVASYLYNTDAPGYFNTYGFIQGGTSPGSEYNTLETSMDALTPYNPADINNLTLNFK